MSTRAKGDAQTNPVTSSAHTNKRTRPSAVRYTHAHTQTHTTRGGDVVPHHDRVLVGLDEVLDRAQARLGHHPSRRGSRQPHVHPRVNQRLMKSTGAIEESKYSRFTVFRNSITKNQDTSSPSKIGDGEIHRADAIAYVAFRLEASDSTKNRKKPSGVLFGQKRLRPPEPHPRTGCASD